MSHQSRPHSEAVAPDVDSARALDLSINIGGQLAQADDVEIAFEPEKLDIELRPADLG